MSSDEGRGQRVKTRDYRTTELPVASAGVSNERSVEKVRVASGFEAPTRIALCIPIYNDWQSAQALLLALDKVFLARRESVQVLFVDDCSTEPAPPSLAIHPKALAKVEILRLRRNLGHQRAIAIGLCHLAETADADGVVVMDGDGEDSPLGITQLIDAFLLDAGDPVIFARRGKRSEGLNFRLGYILYRSAFRLLTGQLIRVGNFSLIPRSKLECLIGVSEIWNHYASAIFKARIPVKFVTIDRAPRLAGQSKMNYLSLVTHGLSSISVFADVVGLRFLLGTGVLGLLSAATLVLVVGIRFLTDLAIPGWATYSAGMLILALLQTATFAVMFVFMTLQGRNISTFLPLRDYHYFVRSIELLTDHGEFTEPAVSGI